jgi:hypothetical protein
VHDEIEHPVRECNSAKQQTQAPIPTPPGDCAECGRQNKCPDQRVGEISMNHHTAVPSARHHLNRLDAKQEQGYEHNIQPLGGQH